MNYFFDNNKYQKDAREAEQEESLALMLCLEHSLDKERRRRSRERKLSESRLQWLERGA